MRTEAVSGMNTGRNHSCHKPNCTHCNRLRSGYAIKPIWEIIHGVRLQTDNRERILEAIYKPLMK